MNTVLFVSPHLDDAVFSCAGAIQREVAAGHRALIVTIFSHGGREHAARRVEDRAAAALLGADIRWLGLRDAPWRSSFYRGFREIVLGTAPCDSHEPISRALSAVVQTEHLSTIYVPLAVGTHIDHRLAFDAVRSFACATTTRFYEDRPYAFARGAVELRLQALGVRHRRFDASSFLTSFRRLPHVRRYLPAGRERRACEAMMLAPSNPSAVRRAKAAVVQFTIREASLARDAAATYKSQWVNFGGSREAWSRRERLYAKSLRSRAPRAERYWTLT